MAQTADDDVSFIGICCFLLSPPHALDKSSISRLLLRCFFWSVGVNDPCDLIPGREKQKTSSNASSRFISWDMPNSNFLRRPFVHSGDNWGNWKRLFDPLFSLSVSPQEWNIHGQKNFCTTKSQFGEGRKKRLQKEFLFPPFFPSSSFGFCVNHPRTSDWGFFTTAAIINAIKSGFNNKNTTKQWMKKREEGEKDEEWKRKKEKEKSSSSHLQRHTFLWPKCKGKMEEWGENMEPIRGIGGQPEKATAKKMDSRLHAWKETKKRGQYRKRSASFSLVYPLFFCLFHYTPPHKKTIKRNSPSIWYSIHGIGK